MRAYIVFSGTGPILIVTTFPTVSDERLATRLRHKGIAKFIAYEVPPDRAREVYGVAFEVVAADLEGQEDVRVLDFNGHHIFANFALAELGPPMKHEG